MAVIIAVVVFIAIVCVFAPLIFRAPRSRGRVNHGVDIIRSGEILTPIPVVGLEEVKEMLGLPTYAALEDLRTHDPLFPNAQGTLSTGPVWWAQSIENYRTRPDRVNVYANIPAS